MNDNRKGLWMTAAAGMALVLAAAGCAHPSMPHVAFAHAPPRTSVNVALAKRAEAVPTPTPKPVVAPSPDMPAARESTTESIADYFTLGNLMMQQEKYDDAIKAYESAVKLDPTFSEAWNHLAICYQNTGQSKKAVEAFKKYKSISQPQPQQ
ncbi:MAG: tetratricopeptide repeat protein [Chthoniobacteraceae bacterium]